MPDRPASDELTAALKQLRRHAARAAQEVERLRAENRALAVRVRELEAAPRIEEDGTPVVLGEDPDALREQIGRYIDTIDHYLAQDKLRA